MQCTIKARRQVLQKWRRKQRRCSQVLFRVVQCQDKRQQAQTGIQEFMWEHLHLFIVRVIKHYHRWLREAVKSSPLEMMTSKVFRTWSCATWSRCPAWVEELDFIYTYKIIYTTNILFILHTHTHTKVCVELLLIELLKQLDMRITLYLSLCVP